MQACSRGHAACAASVAPATMSIRVPHWHTLSAQARTSMPPRSLCRCGTEGQGARVRAQARWLQCRQSHLGEEHIPLGTASRSSSGRRCCRADDPQSATSLHREPDCVGTHRVMARLLWVPSNARCVPAGAPWSRSSVKASPEPNPIHILQPPNDSCYGRAVESRGQKVDLTFWYGALSVFCAF